MPIHKFSMRVREARVVHEPTPCLLQETVGRIEVCQAARCPFWEPGGAVLEPCCLLERLLPLEDWTPELAQRWLRVRTRLASPGDSGRSLFGLLPR